MVIESEDPVLGSSVSEDEPRAPGDSRPRRANRRFRPWGVLFVAACIAGIPWIRTQLTHLAGPVGSMAVVPAAPEPQLGMEGASTPSTPPPQQAEVLDPRQSSQPPPIHPAEAAREEGAAGPFAVHINATPWARMRIDGIDLGETPLGSILLLDGAHAFRAEMADGRVIERDIEIDAENRFVGFE